MGFKTLLALAFFASTLAIPDAEAATCSTVAYHTLTGQPMLETCTGGTVWTVWNYSYSCETVVFHPLTGDPLVERCSEEQCADLTCFDGPVYYRTNLGPDPGVYAACNEPAVDDPFCAFGASIQDDDQWVGAYLYLHEQSPTQPGICYYTEAWWAPECILLDLDG